MCFCLYGIVNLDLQLCVVQGVGFWQMYGPGQIAPDSEGGGQGLYGVYTTDGTFSLVSQVVHQVKTEPRLRFAIGVIQLILGFLSKETQDDNSGLLCSILPPLFTDLLINTSM